MPFWVCHYHIVWSTKGREPFLTPTIETLVYDVIATKSETLDCPIDAMNGTTDHVHVAVRIKPSIAVGQWVSQVKGASSHAVKSSGIGDAFRWQGGYGVLSFGANTLPYVVDYLHRQKDHHDNGTLESYLERIDDD